MNRQLAAAFGAAVALSVSHTAHAFCLTHNCNPSDPNQSCEKDDAGCIVTGVPLSWPSICVGFNVQQAGSVKYGIAADQFAQMVQTALERWTNAPCTTGAVDLNVQYLGPVACDVVENNSPGGNANIWMFRDDIWPYVGGEDALGLTTVHYDLNAPVIQDVDVEINGAAADPLSVGDPATGADLDSILTHEGGHFLGLSHTNVPGATMAPGYTRGDISVRSLAQDDIDAICTAYPNGRLVASVDCAPRHGLSGQCGGADVTQADRPLPEPSCALSRARPGDFSWLGLAAAVSALGARQKSRRRARSADQPQA